MSLTTKLARTSLPHFTLRHYVMADILHSPKVVSDIVARRMHYQPSYWHIGTSDVVKAIVMLANAGYCSMPENIDSPVTITREGWLVFNAPWLSVTGRGKQITTTSH